MPRPSWKRTAKRQCQYLSDMEILRAETEVSSGTNLPPQEASQFVVLQSKSPGIKTITISLEDPETAKKFKHHKRVRVIIEDVE